MFPKSQKRKFFYAKAITYRNVLDLISRYTLDFPDIETGGDLFGFWTHSGCPVIQVVTGPGKDARRSSVSFHQDAGYLRTVHAALYQQHGLQHLGAWHSHHKLDLARPSGYDISTAQAGLEQSSLQQLLVIISNIRDKGTEINAFLFRKKERVPYIPLFWVSSNSENPFYRDGTLEELILPPLSMSKELILNESASNEDILEDSANGTSEEQGTAVLGNSDSMTVDISEEQGTTDLGNSDSMTVDTSEERGTTDLGILDSMTVDTSEEQSTSNSDILDSMTDGTSEEQNPSDQGLREDTSSTH